MEDKSKSQKDIWKEIGQLWNNLSNEDKEKYK